MTPRPARYLIQELVAIHGDDAVIFRFIGSKMRMLGIAGTQTGMIEMEQWSINALAAVAQDREALVRFGILPAPANEPLVHPSGGFKAGPSIEDRAADRGGIEVLEGVRQPGEGIFLCPAVDEDTGDIEKRALVGIDHIGATLDGLHSLQHLLLRDQDIGIDHGDDVRSGLACCAIDQASFVKHTIGVWFIIHADRDAGCQPQLGTASGQVRLHHGKIL
jgi:hypothetical protein